MAPAGLSAQVVPVQGSPQDAFASFDGQKIFVTTVKGQRRQVEQVGPRKPQAPTRAPNGAVFVAACPKDVAGLTFVEIFERWGGTVEGEIRTGTAPADTERIAYASSRPLWQLIGDMNKYSSNQIAESLVRVSAAQALGDGSPEGAQELTRQTLEKYGIDTTGAIFYNGSGLTRAGRITPRQLAGVFQALYTHPEWKYEAMTSMAVYGRDGTVGRRMQNTPLESQVRVKTGSVAGVLTLSGIVECAESDQAMAFALMFQDLGNVWRPTKVWDKFLSSAYDACGED